METSLHLQKARFFLKNMTRWRFRLTSILLILVSSFTAMDASIASVQNAVEKPEVTYNVNYEFDYKMNYIDLTHKKRVI